jgi:seryl-tRNA synthetase
MLNLKRYKKEELKEMLKKRQKNLDIEEVYEAYEIYKTHKKKYDDINKEINLNASYISKDNIEKGKKLKEEYGLINEELKNAEKKYESLLCKIPNILHKSVIYGESEDDNKVIKRVGDIIFHKHHYDMPIFENCVDITGSRFVLLKNQFATLERALSSYMMNKLISMGFSEYSIPVIMNEKGFLGSGHLPKDEENMFKVEHDKYLIPTAEAVLVNIFRNQKIDSSLLPLKLAAVSNCFRKEAGSAGKDLKGLIRLHQFTKCEMVCLSSPKDSYDVLEYMLKCSTAILEELNIPYEILDICSYDIGFVGAKQYDLQIPIGGQWREVASISNCEEYQAVSLNIKNKENEYLHLLNGSALAVGRTLASLIEINYSVEKNCIIIPECLYRYCNFSVINL